MQGWSLVYCLQWTLQTKDYYKILGLPPSATHKEIKSAYRRLAHQLHPDKNDDDPYSSSQFELVKEAYEVLTNPSRKAYYLQQRWYDQVMNKKGTTTSVTPVTILKQCIELDQYVARLDVHRMDQEGLYAYVTELLSDGTIEKLNTFNERDINDSIIESLLKTGRSLPYSFVEPLCSRLMKINVNKATLEKIRLHVLQAKRAHQWNKYKIWLLLLIVVLICLLIYDINA